MAPSAESPGWRPPEVPHSSAVLCMGDRRVQEPGPRPVDVPMGFGFYALIFQLFF